MIGQFHFMKKSLLYQNYYMYKKIEDQNWLAGALKNLNGVEEIKSFMVDEGTIFIFVKRICSIDVFK